MTHSSNALSRLDVKPTWCSTEWKKVESEHHPPLLYTAVKKILFCSPPDFTHHCENHPPTTIYLCPSHRRWRTTWPCPPPHRQMLGRSWAKLGSAVVILGSLSDEFICHGWRAGPEGRLDTLRWLWLSLPQSISVSSITPALVCSILSTSFPLHQHINISFYLPSVSLSSIAFSIFLLYCYLSACAPLSQDWTSYSSQKGTSTRTIHAWHRWVSLSVHQDRLYYKMAHPVVI